MGYPRLQDRGDNWDKEMSVEYEETRRLDMRMWNQMEIIARRLEVTRSPVASALASGRE